MDLTLVVILSILVLIVAVLRGLQALKHTRDTYRGAEPGTGYHDIDATDHSGGGGGGHQTTYRIPRDPQEYAKRFIPKDKPK